MNFDEIKQILDMMREHELSEFELERDDFKLRLRKNTAGTWNGTSTVRRIERACSAVRRSTMNARSIRTRSRRWAL